MARAKTDRPFGLESLCDASETEHRRGIDHLAFAASTVAVIAVVPYIVPPLAAMRPWVPGEGIPIARLFDAQRESASMSIATGGANTRDQSDGLNESILANLEDDEPLVDPLRSTSEPGEPGEHDSQLAQYREVRVEPSELEGLTVELEDPNHALDAFYDSLRRTASDEAGAITRIAHFGDSSIALDGITQTVRHRMQSRFGDAGHGWVLAAKGTLPYRHHGVVHDSNEEWRLMDISRAPLSNGHYGLGGYQARSTAGGRSTFRTADEDSPIGRQASVFEVFFERHRRGGRFSVRVDDEDPVVVDTRSESGDETDDRYRVEIPDGPHRFEVRTVGHGESHLYGVVLERATPGVVYDSLGMVGARARRFLGFDETHLRRQFALRGTSLVVIGYGGNDADDEYRDVALFEDDFRRIARLVRAASPEGSCLFFAPLDQGERDERGQIQTMRLVPVIVEAMRTAAREEGCAFFNTFEAMGGEGGMARWYRSRPRLAFSDFRHATPAGYRVLGNMFYKALLKGFADYLERH